MQIDVEVISLSWNMKNDQQVEQPSHSHIFFIKGALCSFGEEIQTRNRNIYNINEVKNTNLEIFISFHKWINKLFSEENEVQNTFWS